LETHFTTYTPKLQAKRVESSALADASLAEASSMEEAVSLFDAKLMKKTADLASRARNIADREHSKRKSPNV